MLPPRPLLLGTAGGPGTWASGQSCTECRSPPMRGQRGWRIKSIRLCCREGGRETRNGVCPSVHHWWVPVERDWVTAGHLQELLMTDTVFWDFAGRVGFNSRSGNQHLEAFGALTRTEAFALEAGGGLGAALTAQGSPQSSGHLQWMCSPPRQPRWTQCLGDAPRAQWGVGTGHLAPRPHVPGDVCRARVPLHRRAVLVLGPRPDHRVLHARPTSSQCPRQPWSVLGMAGTEATVLSRAGRVWGNPLVCTSCGPWGDRSCFCPSCLPPAQV